MKAGVDNPWPQKYEERLQWFLRNPGNLEVLECDACHTQIGWVYEFDMNGSYVFCEDCVKAAAAAEV